MSEPRALIAYVPTQLPNPYCACDTYHYINVGCRLDLLNNLDKLKLKCSVCTKLLNPSNIMAIYKDFCAECVYDPIHWLPFSN